MKAISYTSDAQDEYDAALALSNDPPEFRRAIRDALDDIASGRVAHAQVPRTPCRRCVLNTPPFSIVYTETDDEIRVVALAHHKRRRNYWKSRLPND